MKAETRQVNLGTQASSLLGSRICTLSLVSAGWKPACTQGSCSLHHRECSSFINKGRVSFAFEKSVHHSLRLIRGDRLRQNDSMPRSDGLVRVEESPTGEAAPSASEWLGVPLRGCALDPAVDGLVRAPLSGTTFSRSPQRSASRADIVSPV